jgi:hypothetical protein
MNRQFDIAATQQPRSPYPELEISEKSTVAFAATDADGSIFHRCRYTESTRAKALTGAMEDLDQRVRDEEAHIVCCRYRLDVLAKVRAQLETELANG